MYIFKLSQKEFRDMDIFAHTMIIRANNVTEARELAQSNENIERDGEIDWLRDTSASCEIVTEDGQPEVILVA